MTRILNEPEIKEAVEASHSRCLAMLRKAERAFEAQLDGGDSDLGLRFLERTGVLDGERAPRRFLGDARLQIAIQALTAGSLRGSSQSKPLGPARPKYHPPSVPRLCAPKEETMQWYHIVAYFFGGAFFVNAIPHFTNGVSGRPFPSPFASPAGKGLSSPTVNVLWGTLNLVIAYMLLRVGGFHFRRTREVLIAGVGGLLMAAMLSREFGNREAEK